MADTQTSKEVAVVNNEIVMPAVDGLGAIEAWNAYQDLKNKILDPKVDIQTIKGQEFKKKSYWRKVATFFNLTIETREERHEMVGRTMVWHFTVRAIAPNGRYIEGIGSCDVYEKATLRDGEYKMPGKNGGWYPATPNSLHNTRSTAYTRAFNRAVSDLVGGGEVSAEEVDRESTQPGERDDVNTETGEIISKEE